ncbi:MAG: NAD(+) kinase [Gammaproteobacteria bacterium]|nr:NAD(+) kinase [Gammaproteobacteria bacterium]
MKSKFKHVGLIAKQGDPRVADTLLRLAELMVSFGCKISIERRTAANLLIHHNFPTCDSAHLGETCDLVISIGGDGTLLHTARSLIDHDVPLLGINLGRLGFLVDISPDQMHARLEEIFSGNYLEEQRIMLIVSIGNARGPLRVNHAFNDVVVHKWEVARMIEVDTYIDERLLNSMRSDGLIIATPTGSTAYALSGGGPIMDPDMDAMVIVPICPHSMNYRPYVFDGNCEVEMRVQDSSCPHSQVSCDGQISMAIQPGDVIRVKRHPKRVRLIHPPEYNHFQVLRTKLRWGEHS